METHPSTSIAKRIFCSTLACLAVAFTAAEQPRLAASEMTAASGPPVITEFFPASAPVGDRVVLRGYNLGGTTEVKFNGAAARFEVTGDIDPSRFMVMAYVPQDATTGPITLATPDGTYSTTQPFTVVDGTPSITSFSPTSGIPGSMFFVYGDNLKYATNLLLNGQEVQWGPGIDPINVHLMARVPSGATSGRITVKSPYGEATSQENFTVTAPPPLTVTDWPVETEAGVVHMLKVNDNFFIKDVQLNGTSIPFIGFSPMDLIITIPTNATTGTLTIITDRETVTSPQPLVIHPKPAITAVEPKSGLPGAIVQVRGENFENVSQLWLGNVALAFARVDNGMLSFSVPNARGGLISVGTRFATTYSQVEFGVASGAIKTSSGSISGAIPGSAPAPITVVTPAGGVRLTGALQAVEGWTGPVLANDPAPASPTLSRARSSGNALLLRWPVAGSAGYVLESCERVETGWWQAVSQAPVVKNGANELVVPSRNGQAFFRLSPKANAHGQGRRID